MHDVIWPAYDLRDVENPQREIGPSRAWCSSGKVLRVGRGWSNYGKPTMAEVIALAHVKARTMRDPGRRSRWIDWLRSRGACRDGMHFASLHLSPEEAVQASARSASEFGHVYWLLTIHRETPFRMWRAYIRAKTGVQRTAAAQRYLASPEWAALPWQRDPGGQP